MLGISLSARNIYDRKMIWRRRGIIPIPVKIGTLAHSDLYQRYDAGLRRSPTSGWDSSRCLSSVATPLDADGKWEFLGTLSAFKVSAYDVS